MRLSGDNKEGYKPTLKCNGTVINDFVEIRYKSTNEKLTEKIPMYVNSLTADEVVYAGGSLEQSNYYYLTNRHFIDSGISFGTLSPVYNEWQIDYFAYALGNGKLVIESNNDYYWLRPSVSLISNITITDGEGTIDNPYVIE